MNTISFVVLQIISVVVLVGLLNKANYKKEERHKQLWFVWAAIILSGIILYMDRYILNFFTEIIQEYFPIVMDYILLFFNYTILVVFLLIKIVGKTFGKVNSLAARFFKRKGTKRNVFKKLFLAVLSLLPDNLQKKVMKKEPNTVAFVYQMNGNKVLLKPEWLFARSLATYISYIPFAFVIFFIVNSVYHWISPISWGFPEYPMLSFLLLAELAWFLGGDVPHVREGSITGKDAIATKKSQYEQLFQEYKERFPERILVADEMVADRYENDYSIPTDVPSEQRNTKLAYEICNKLNKQGKIVRQEHIRLLTNLLNEKNLLLENVSYDDLAPFVIAGIHQLLIKGKKMIVIANSGTELEAIITWFQDGFRKEAEGFQYIWKVERLDVAMEKNINADILVVTPAQLLLPTLFQYLSNDVDVSKYEMVFILEASRILSEYDTVLHAFIWKLQDYLQRPPLQIVLSRWYEGLDEEIRDVLRIKPEDFSVRMQPSPNLFYLVWKQEGEEWLQSKIIPKYSHRQLDTEAVISLPAVKYGVHDIYLSNQHNSAAAESIKELADNRSILRQYGITKENVDSFREKFHYIYSSLTFKREEHSFVIVRDTVYNFINTLSDWWASGKQYTFVHVVSPPYLLRDYLVANRDFFLENSEKISPIVPELSRTTWSMAYLLIERLCNSEMLEEEVLSYLKKVGYGQSNKPVIEQLNQFLQKVLQTSDDFKPFIETMELEEFSSKKLGFVKKVTYKFTKSMYNELVPNWFEFYEFRTRTGEVIGEIIAGNIYQNLLPGQKHAINGNLYKIDSISPHTKSIELIYESQTQKYTYHQNRTFKFPELNGMEEKTNSHTIKENEVRFSLYQCEVEVVTHGYFHFTHGIDLNDEKLMYKNLTDHEQEIYDRNYPNGNVLKIEWKLRNKTFTNSNQIAFTLSFLFNELFVSLFPHGYKYLAVSTVFPDSFFDMDKFFEVNLKKYVPKVHKAEENTDNSIYLYIMEDTPIQMGMLERIVDKWNHLLEIVEDYMYWLLHEEPLESKNHYIYLGADTIFEQFNLEETILAIQSLLPDNRLRTQRENHKFHAAEMEVDNIDKRKCDFCKDSFPSSEFINLDDGRERCTVCHQSSIDTTDDFEKLYERARQFFINDLNIELRPDIHLKMVNAKEIQQLSGQEFVPTEDFDARIVGKAMRVNDKSEIYIENGAPRLQCLATLIHELTHIWQFDNLNLNNMSLDDLEGHASWMEVYVMRKMGSFKEADILHHEFLEREDAYGRGYRKILATLENYPEGSTPFDFYLERNTA